MVSESQYQCSFCSLSSPHADVQTDMTDDRYLCPTLSWKLICHVKLWYCLPDTFIIHFSTLKWLLISTETISLASALALISEKVPAEISDQLENESVGSNLWVGTARLDVSKNISNSVMCDNLLEISERMCSLCLYPVGVSLLLIFWVDLTHSVRL